MVRFQIQEWHVMNMCYVPIWLYIFSQSNHQIGLKFHQYQYVTILFNPNDQDLNMNFTKSRSLGTIY